MRVAITGASGFVGPHFAEALRRLSGSSAEIIATSKVGGEHPVLGRVHPLDVTDRAALGAFIADTQPTHVVHLAGIAAPTAASANPDLAWRVHLDGTLNLARAILRECPDCWLINVGSGLVYGGSADTGHALDECSLLAPKDEYSASKAAADLALGAMVCRGQKCVRLRPFNHTGPGQSDDFFVSAMAMQVARIEAGLAEPVVSVGNLDAIRDYLDVRDVAHAYALVVAASSRLEPGLILNVASGEPRRSSDVLEALVASSRVAITVQQDPRRMRKSEIPRMVGDAQLARDQLGWQPFYSFDATLQAVLDDCRRRCALSTARSG